MCGGGGVVPMRRVYTVAKHASTKQKVLAHMEGLPPSADGLLTEAIHVLY